jgi:hypothetical protein
MIYQLLTNVTQDVTISTMTYEFPTELWLYFNWSIHIWKREKIQLHQQMFRIASILFVFYRLHFQTENIWKIPQHNLQSANFNAPVKLCGRQFSGHEILIVCNLYCDEPTNQPFCLGVGIGWLPRNFPQR